jgi:hypothetical protein
MATATEAPTTPTTPDSEIKIAIGKMIFYITCAAGLGFSIGSLEFNAPAKAGYGQVLIFLTFAKSEGGMRWEVQFFMV